MNHDTYHQAMNSPESKKWLEAMNAEMQSMQDNKVIKKKTDIDGKVNTFKARIVAKGYTQTQGVDYSETYSPIVSTLAIIILFFMAANYDYEIWKMDMKTAFLNGRLYEDVYMEQPEGFHSSKFPKRVCKLHRSIFSFKQTSHSWNKRFDEKIKEFGFIQNTEEPCVYKRTDRRKVVFLIMCIDDILMMGNDIPTMQGLEDELSVKGYTGASFQTNRDDTKSQSGYVFIMNGEAVAWRSSKQDTIEMSSTESEYIVISKAVKTAY
ncbi:retrotransposon protein, putative, ty1-copia subclass [Tanacetum coccineum]